MKSVDTIITITYDFCIKLRSEEQSNSDQIHKITSISITFDETFKILKEIETFTIKIELFKHLTLLKRNTLKRLD